MSNYSIGYQQLQTMASQAGLAQSGSELHGRMLGMICVDSGRNRNVLQKLACDESLELQEAACLQDAVEQLYHETWEALDGVGLGFALLLPEDVSRRERCQGLVDWARGFLRGLAIAGVDGGHDLEMNGRHALSDIARIAEYDPDQAIGDDEDYEEACEFVWVAAVLVRELLVTRA